MTEPCFVCCWRTYSTRSTHSKESCFRHWHLNYTNIIDKLMGRRIKDQTNRATVVVCLAVQWCRCHRWERRWDFVESPTKKEAGAASRGRGAIAAPEFRPLRRWRERFVYSWIGAVKRVWSSPASFRVGRCGECSLVSSVRRLAESESKNDLT